MKLLFTNVRISRTGRITPADGDADRPLGDDSLGRGMDLALTVLVFTGIGWLIDRWLGWFPVVTIVLLVLSSIGIFFKMKAAYDARMVELEAEHRAARSGRASQLEDAA
jgi:hypothetical protein